MATVVKDFKIKSGLIVEGTTGTINNYDILTKKQGDVDYIVNLIGGTATSDNTPDTVVKRDSNGSFSATTVTVDTLEVGSMGTINTASGDELAITAAEGEDIRLSADDVRVDAIDDFRVNVGGDILLATSGIGNNVYVGSIDTGNEVVVESTLDAHIGDATVDGTAGNTVYDRIFNAKAEAIADAGAYTDGEISDLDVSLKLYADQAEADAISTAAADATLKADAAEASANSYTDDEISALDLSLKAYADQAESDAVTSANSYTDTRETAITTAYQAYADQVEIDAKAYADQKVTDLIGGAPALLDTLNEIAAAIADDENFATTVTNNLALKADITYVDSEISALDGASQEYADQAEANANLYTDGKITQEVADRNLAISDAISEEVTNRNTAIGVAIDQEVIDRNAAITAAVDAIDTDDIEEGVNNLYFTNQRAIDAVGGTIGDAIDELTTDDIEEGASNLYYTSQRALADAASLLTGATQTNITITGDGSGLTITAENGVADSTTDDLDEGSSNLYFTDSRAVSALEAVVPNFTEIDINSVATQVAATQEVSVASQAVAYAWAKADYRSAEFLVKVAYSTHTEVSKVILTMDSSDNIAITEYAIVGTNGSASTISAGINGTDAQLLVTTVNNGSTVTVVGTLLA